MRHHSLLSLAVSRSTNTTILGNMGSSPPQTAPNERTGSPQTSPVGGIGAASAQVPVKHSPGLQARSASGLLQQCGLTQASAQQVAFASIVPPLLGDAVRAQGTSDPRRRNSVSVGMNSFAPAARCVSLCSKWNRGTSKVKTTVVQLDGLCVPPSTCCVHAVPSSSSPVLSEEVLLKVKKQHERGLERGSGKCLQNIRNDWEEFNRSRLLPLVLCADTEATEDERIAISQASEFVAGKTIQDLTASDIIEQLNRHLPGKWRLENSGVTIMGENTWRLRDSLPVAPGNAERVLLTVGLPPNHATSLGKPNKRIEDLKGTMIKVETRRKRTKGTPESENATRALVGLKKKLKLLEHQTSRASNSTDVKLHRCETPLGRTP